jgi:hypothetical protein
MRGMNMWNEAMDELVNLESEAREDLSLDQRIQLLQVRALLSVSQELSKIHHEGISPEYRP